MSCVLVVRKFPCFDAKKEFEINDAFGRTRIPCEEEEDRKIFLVFGSKIATKLRETASC